VSASPAGCADPPPLARLFRPHASRPPAATGGARTSIHPSEGIVVPSFVMPEPISVTIELLAGDIRITASDRVDTVVNVRPGDPSQDQDVRAAEQTWVEYEAARLLVKTPKQRGLGLFGKTGSVDVTIDLPTGSHLQGDAQMSTFRCIDDLGECRVKTAVGEVQVDRAERLDLNTGAGALLAHQIRGQADVTTGSGNVRIREIDGAAVIRNSNGDTWVGEACGDVRVSAAIATSPSTWHMVPSPPTPPTEISGSSTSPAARPRSRPAMGRSRSASGAAPRPASTSTPPSGASTSSWTRRTGPHHPTRRSTRPGPDGIRRRRRSARLTRK